MRHALPALWAIGGALVLAAGYGASALIARAGLDTALHDTYYVAAHERFVWQLFAPFAVFALVYLLVAFSGRTANPWLAGAHLAFSFAAAGLLLAPALILGFEGMPRRYARSGTT